MNVSKNRKPEYIDLGLSVKWATMNIGAEKISDYGDYFAWGETCSKDDYSWGTYKYGTSADDLTKYNYDDNRMSLEPADDAAMSNLGGRWRMPTGSEWEELCNKCNCKWEWTTVEGTPGYMVTSKKQVIQIKASFSRLQDIFAVVRQKDRESRLITGHLHVMSHSRIVRYAFISFRIL